MIRTFKKFMYKQAVYNISAHKFPEISSLIPGLWKMLETHISHYPDFLNSFSPLPQPDDCSDLIKQMYTASALCEVGPMAGVAGLFSEAAVKLSLSEVKDEDVIVENGGDIYMHLQNPLTLGIYAEDSPLSGKIAFEIQPDETPLAVCSSSGKMGNSESLGLCSLATVFSKDAALADCTATKAANMVSHENDIQKTLDVIMEIPGIAAVFIIQNSKSGISGRPPKIIKMKSEGIRGKVTIHPGYKSRI